MARLSEGDLSLHKLSCFRMIAICFFLVGTIGFLVCFPSSPFACEILAKATTLDTYMQSASAIKPHFPRHETMIKHESGTRGFAQSTAKIPLRKSKLKECLLPKLTKLQTIISMPDAHLRDPTSPIYHNGLWHVWTTSVRTSDGVEGTRGKVHHFFSSELRGQWNTSGVAIDVSEEEGSFDHAATFTPSSFWDKETGLWVLFYSGIPSHRSLNTRYRVGQAVSSSPFGPWKKSPLNPVITETDLTWCKESSTGARVDEAEPYFINGRAVLLVKGVCSNFTALPMLFSSARPANRHNDTSRSFPFRPPFAQLSPNPLIRASETARKLGFEQARLFRGVDDCVHLTGHDHGDSTMPHFIAQGGTGDTFGTLHRAGSVDTTREFTPVWPKGETPGDQSVPIYFIQFEGNPMHIDLLKVDWVPIQETRIGLSGLNAASIKRSLVQHPQE